MTIRDISELIGLETLELRTANGTKLPFAGWVEIGFELSCANNTVTQLMVPFLISNYSLELPIIGYNVIEQVVSKVEDEFGVNETLPMLFSENFKGEAKQNTTAIINFIKSASQTKQELCVVKTNKRNSVVPQLGTAVIACRANTGYIDTATPALLEPEINDNLPSGLQIQETLVTLQRGKSCIIHVLVTNNSKHDIVLKGRTVIGCLQLVRLVTQLDVELKGDESSQSRSTDQVNEIKVERKESHRNSCVLEGPLADIDLGDLTEEQRATVTQMLIDKADSFSQDDTDIGCIPDFQMNLNLADTEPVQRKYARVPRPLYDEVKRYIEDLLNRGLIQASRSSYASPIVCVRKKRR